MSGYFLEYPLTLVLAQHLYEGMKLNPFVTFFLIAQPTMLAMPIVVGEVIYRLGIAIKNRLSRENAAKADHYFGAFLNMIVIVSAIIMLAWGVIPQRLMSFAFDKRAEIFRKMQHRWNSQCRGDNWPSRQIKNFNGTIWQNAGPDGLWNTSDDIVYLESPQKQIQSQDADVCPQDCK